MIGSSFRFFYFYTFYSRVHADFLFFTLPISQAHFSFSYMMLFHLLYSFLLFIILFYFRSHVKNFVFACPILQVCFSFSYLLLLLLSPCSSFLPFYSSSFYFRSHVKIPVFYIAHFASSYSFTYALLFHILSSLLSCYFILFYLRPHV